MLLSLVSTLVPIAEGGKLIMQISKHLHTYLYRPRNISILNRPFFLKIHFGTEWNTNQSIFVSYFNFLSLSSLYCLVSYLFTPIVLLSFYIFQKLDLFVIVIIRMYRSYSSETGVNFIYLPHIYILYAFHQPVYKGLLSRGRIKGVLGQSVFGKAEIIPLFCKLFQYPI